MQFESIFSVGLLAVLPLTAIVLISKYNDDTKPIEQTDFYKEKLKQRNR